MIFLPVFDFCMLLSAWRDKFALQVNNSDAVQKKYTKQIINMYRKDKTLRLGDVTFEEFLKFVVFGGKNDSSM